MIPAPEASILKKKQLAILKGRYPVVYPRAKEALGVFHANMPNKKAGSCHWRLRAGCAWV